MMTEKPILFSAPMVRALLDGSKTQTRRVIKLPHNNSLGVWEATTIGGPSVKTSKGLSTIEEVAVWHTRTGDALLCQHGSIGDQLWVRETFNINHVMSAKLPKSERADVEILYRATDLDYLKNMDMEGWQGWKPPIFMPRWASRIQLEITKIEVERLQDISETDAKAEGAKTRDVVYPDEPPSDYSYFDQYKSIWESINGSGSWQSNPLVWVLEFKVINARR